MQFWLVGFGLSLAKMASENFRHFYSGKKPQIEINSERTQLTSTLLTNMKVCGNTEIPKSKRTVTLFQAFSVRSDKRQKLFLPIISCA